MSQEIILATTDSDAEFMAKLNQATNFGNTLPRPKFLSFQSVNGIWNLETDEKDGDNKSIYREIGPETNFHIITSKKMVETRDRKEGEMNFFSREFEDGFVEVYDENKELAFRGLYDELKNKPENKWLYEKLAFKIVLYVYAGQDPQLYRVKIKGSQLGKYFDYLNSFAGKNPAMYMTHCKLGRRMKGGQGTDAVPATQEEIQKYADELAVGRKPALNLFYELNFIRGVEVERGLIVSRVNAVNEYLLVYNQTVNKYQGQNGVAPVEQLSDGVEEPVQDNYPTEDPLTPEQEAEIDALPKSEDTLTPEQLASVQEQPKEKPLAQDEIKVENLSF